MFIMSVWAYFNVLIYIYTETLTNGFKTFLRVTESVRVSLYDLSLKCKFQMNHKIIGRRKSIYGVVTKYFNEKGYRSI